MVFSKEDLNKSMAKCIVIILIMYDYWDERVVVGLVSAQLGWSVWVFDEWDLLRTSHSPPVKKK